MIKSILWQVGNFIANVIFLLLLGLIIWLVYIKTQIDTSNFFFRTWWHTSGLILLILFIMGSLMNYFEDKKPMRVREREIRKSSIKAEKKSRSVQINQQKVANTKGGGVGNFALGAFAGYIVGKKQAGKGSFRIEKWSSRVTRKHGGVRGGNSFVVKDRNQAFAEAHKAMKQNPKGEVKVVDQSNHQVILKLP